MNIRVPRRPLTLFLILAPGPAAAQAVQPGAWDVTFTVLELSVAGVPGFLQRLARGMAKAEHKRLAAGQGVDALLALDPKAKCRVDRQTVADGCYAQAIACPQKGGEAIHVHRAGSYDAAEFRGRATVTGVPKKGPLTIVHDQRAARIGA